MVLWWYRLGINQLEAGSDSQVLCKELSSNSVLTPFMSQLPHLSLHAQTFKLLEISSSAWMGFHHVAIRQSWNQNYRTCQGKQPPHRLDVEAMYFLQEELSLQVILYFKIRNLKSLLNGIHQGLGRDKRWELLYLQGDGCDFQAFSAPERWKFLLYTEVVYSFEHMEGGSFSPLGEAVRDLSLVW